MELYVKIFLAAALVCLSSCVDKNYKTLREASKYMDSDSMYYFVKTKDANPNYQDERGRSLLFKAALMNDLRLLKILIEKNAALDLADADNTTPLMIAAIYGYEDFAQILLDAGANPNVIRDSDEFTALMYSRQYGHSKISKMLESAGAIQTREIFYSLNARMLLSAEMGNLSELRQLVELDKSSINAKYVNTQKTALMIALENGNEEIARYLIKHGARLDLKDKNQKTAADYDRFSILE
ncbi:MAG: ankyrin repeat domain-containing protein [Helicobacteraceae bacterium]